MYILCSPESCLFLTQFNINNPSILLNILLGTNSNIIPLQLSQFGYLPSLVALQTDPYSNHWV